MKEGLYGKKLKADRVICSLCHHQCLISPDALGLCEVRQNKKGKIYALNYPKISGEASIDIEKAPLFHFYPSSKAYAVQVLGNNFKEDLAKTSEKKATPQQLVKRALRSDCKTLLFDHNEPTMAMEMLLESAKLARSNKIKCVLKTNGYVQDRPLKDIMKTMHAVILELPSANKDIFYELTGAKLHHVTKNLQVLNHHGMWVEIVTKFEEKNAIQGEIQKLIELIASISKTIPWHIQGSITPERTAEIKTWAKDAGLKFVYAKGDKLVCPKTNKPLVDKEGVHVKKNISEFGKVKVEGVF